MKTKRVFSVSKEDGPADSTLRARIITGAGGLFLERGFIRVTADDLAAEVGISKATLYKAFPSKEAVLREVLRQFMNDILTGVEALIRDTHLGFVAKLASLFSFLGTRLSRLRPPLVGDIRRCSPNLWKEIEEFRKDKILKNFKLILEAGRREGFFREDIDADLLLRMYLALIQEFLNPDAVLRDGRIPSETFGSIVRVFFQGLLTDRARGELANLTLPINLSAKEMTT